MLSAKPNSILELEEGKPSVDRPTSHYFNITEKLSASSMLPSTLLALPSSSIPSNSSMAGPPAKSTGTAKASSGAKTDIGIGVGIGVPLILLLAVLYYRQGGNGEKLETAQWPVEAWPDDSVAIPGHQGLPALTRFVSGIAGSGLPV